MMNWQAILGVAFLTVAYGGIVAVLAWVLLRMGAPARWAIALSFLIFGVGSGLLATWAWPYDSCVLPNLWAVLLGDALYQGASAVADIPALLTAPWSYPLAGAILYGVLGLVVQLIANRRRTRRAERGKGRSIRT